MTQAVNLATLASSTDSSGKASLTTGVTGTLPVANGGTGLTSVGTNGQVLTSNGSTLSWASPSGGVTSVTGGTGISVSASTGAVTITNTLPASTTPGDIGTYFVGYGSMSWGTSFTPGSTTAGTNLRCNNNTSQYSPFGSFAASNPTNYTASAGYSGTWKAICYSKNGNPDGYGNFSVSPNLWLRIS